MHKKTQITHDKTQRTGKYKKNRHMTLKIHKDTHHKPRTPHTHHNTGPAQDRTKIQK